MKTTKSVLIAGVLTIITAFAIMLAPAPVESQILTDFSTWRPVPVIRTADDTDVKILIRYVGTTAAGGTVTVSAAGDISLAEGAVGASVADDTLECPVSGALGGIIDVSDAACNTVDEVVDKINSSENWVAVVLDGFLTDDMNCGGSGCLLARSETLATAPEGLPLYVDTDVALNSTIALVPPEARRLDYYLAGPATLSAVLRRNPFGGYRTIVASQLATSTYAAGTSLMTISEVVPSFLRSNTTENVTAIYGPIAGGATTVSKTFIALSDPVKVLANSDTKVVLRLTNDTNMSVVTHTALGYRAPYPR